MSRIDSTNDSDRGQAYTLEGFISAMVVLMAILLALQSVVITPTTGGLADRTVKSQVQQEAQDALVVAATTDHDKKKNLSEMIRYWDKNEGDDGEFHKASESNDVPGYYNASNQTELYEQFVLGEILSDRFTERGMSYNIELVYWNQSEDEYQSEYLVYQGESEAVTANYMVTLFEDDELLKSNNDVGDDTNYPIARGTKDDNDDDSKVYNVVEVRVAVW
ncbi:DUF7288 family protein [Natronorubrum thiooxidans]|uniref:Uncharacterized protein n=1 Tax=Natronorubrum thiooxidans TaxID=308853 RepID=A0A1N7DD26_9EURY|nr:hypothetical protein [Natronorubrum thiooxidans]SIR73645.1 hypothetical protein SAMN05421752_102161 [Natronorubrum thiooxidans]